MNRRSTYIIVSLALLSIAAPTSLVSANTVFGPSADDLNEDIAKVEDAIGKNRERCAVYGDGSLLMAQCKAENGFLLTTKAMLEQKRISWLRWINLSYTVAGQPQVPLSAEEAREIEAEIAKANAELAVAVNQARNYGGLIQSMALAEVQTQRVSISILRQNFLMRKYGVAVPVQLSPAPKQPVGNTVDDKGAL
ncbi:hypothetical protein [Methylorubrum extorquens]